MIYQIDETRERILAGAQSLFTSRGFFDTQMTDIAQAIGMSRNTLYRYFKDKAALGLVIVERILVSMADWIDQDLRTQAALRQLSCLEQLGLYLADFVANPRFAPENRFMAEFDAYFSGSRLDAAFIQRLKAAVSQSGLRTLQQLIANGIAEGSIRDDLAPELLMVTLINAVRALHQRLLLRSPALVELETARTDLKSFDLVTTLIQLLLDGLKPQRNNPAGENT